MRKLTQRGSMLRVAAIGVACVLGLATDAMADDSISVTSGPDPTEEVPVPIKMRWTTAYPNPFVVVSIKPSGGLGCGATHAIDDPHSTDVMAWRGGFSGARVRRWTFWAPGSWTLCGYLQRSNEDPSPLAVTGPITLTARAARATVAIVAPTRVGPGRAFLLRVPVTSELPRRVVVTRKLAVPGAACASPYALEDPISLAVLVAQVQGAQVRARVVDAPRASGTYLLCAYVLEANPNSAPEATASMTYVVGPDACMTAKAALAAADDAVKTADGHARRHHRAYTRYRNRARHAHGDRRTRLLRLATRHRLRYRSATRLLDRARAARALAQLNVTTACPGRR